MKTAISLLFLYLLVAVARGQDNRQTIDAIIGNLISEQEEATPEEYVEKLIMLSEQPVNINFLTRDRLEEFYFLTETDIRLLLEYIEEHKPVLSIYELLAIEGIDPETIKQLSPFITAGPPDQSRRIRLFAPGKNQLLLRTDRTMEKKKGYRRQDPASPPSYGGSPWKYLLKFRSYQTDRYSLGFTAEHDPGESFSFSSGQPGFDFASGHLSLKGLSQIVDEIIIGDFKANFGQGLTVGSGFHFGKNPYAISAARRKSDGLKPYTSAYESGYLRGAALALKLGAYKITSFYSGKKIDGRIQSDLSGDEYAASINVTGLHRTQHERSNRRTMHERTAGGAIEYGSTNRDLKLGLSYLHTRFNMPLIPDATVYNQFYFKGRQSWNTGFYVNVRWRSFHAFAEIAASELKSFAGIAGLQAHLSPRISASAAYRNYGRNYNAFYASPFGESSFRNEEGIYWGFRIKFNRRLSVGLYYDMFRFPWLKYQVYAPSEGNEFLARLNFNPNETIRMYSQIKLERKQKNTNENALYKLQDYRRANLQLYINYTPRTWVNLTGKIQRSIYDESNRSTGVSYAQDINFLLGAFKWYNRLFLFRTDDFDSRQYVYEKDVLYAFSYPSFSDRGLRWYSVIEFDLFETITAWIKVSQSIYADRQVIGTGPEEIDGNKKTDLKIQLRYKF